MSKMDTGIVNIHGKEYSTVAKRISDFRQNDKFADFQVTTEIIHAGDEAVVMKANIFDASGRLCATGHAEEFRAASKINRTSALENAETSAIGRALACLGIGGTSFASADEVQRAVEQQKPASALQIDAIKHLMKEGQVKKEHLVAVFGVTNPDELYAVEAARILNAFDKENAQ